MIRTAAVLGAGSMGSQIAAFLASAGLDVLLLDVSAQAAHGGLERLKKVRPEPFFTPEAALRIQTAGFEVGLPHLAACDWIVEAIVERAETKQGMFAGVDAVRRKGTWVSTATSSLPVAVLAAGRSEDFRRHFLGTHFFNPPRYLRLLELVPGPETDPAVVERVRNFADVRLGKGVVVAKDTPGFIANHLGIFAVFRALEALAAGPFSIEEIDELTGPLVGRPKSATFRTMDLAGIDVLGIAAGTLARSAPPEVQRLFALPPLVDELIDRGWHGEKTGQGFYKRVKLPGGDSRVLVLDPRTFEYRPLRGTGLPALDRLRAIDDPGARIRALFTADDDAGAFTRATLGATLRYAATVAPAIAHSIDDVDRAMRWGFGWELGPFEILDAIGVRTFVECCPQPQEPPLIGEALARSGCRFRGAPLPPAAPGCEVLREAKARSRVVAGNREASLVDLDDGVLAVEFHSKMNTIGADAVAMIARGLDEATVNHRALVIGNEAPNFSAGANLVLVLEAAREGRWDDIDRMVRAFQQATMSLKYASVPVVAAPAGLALGGGCEIVLHADRVRAAAETYLGLVETGVGLIPAGGGTKELLVRSLDRRAAVAPGNLLPSVQDAFETIALARVSANGPDAVRLGYLRRGDSFSMNPDRLLADAKACALARVAEGYLPPEPALTVPVGGEGLEAALRLGLHLHWRAGRISEFDVLIGRRLAWVLAGGSLPHATTVSEAYLLDLEREAFLGLCGEAKTRDRIEHMLKTGKALRN